MCDIYCLYFRIFTLFICLILSLFSPSSIKAEIYYENDFNNNNNLEDWTISGGTSLDWNINNGFLNGFTSSGREIFLNLNNFNRESYKIKFKTINYSGVDQNIVLKSSQNFNVHYVLGFRYSDSRWPQDNNNIVLYKYSPVYDYQLVSEARPNQFNDKFFLSQNIWHDIEIILDVKSIKVYFDNVEVINYFDSYSPYIGSGGFSFQSHGGNFPYDTKYSIDDLKIMSLDHIDISNSQPKNKIIIIPGLGASWNLLQ